MTCQTATVSERSAERHATLRHYLMCPPTYYTVSYEINPWMDATQPVDTALAQAQWQTLRDTLVGLGHTVELIEPLPGCPDMVYAANGATVVDGTVYTARFRYPQRAAEGPAYARWFTEHGYPVHEAAAVNEGQGDLLPVAGVLLAGTGWRTERAAHAEAARLLGRRVVSLELVDARFYHLDTALGVLDDAHVVYYPPAFSPASQAALARMFPDALVATDTDARALGLNLVSDGRHVVCSPAATDLAAALTARGYQPVPVDTSELLRGGGGAKCCTLEIHPEARR